MFYLVRYNITSEGDLVIGDVSYTDVGTYQCYAKNKFGEKSAFGSLVVKSLYILITIGTDDCV